MRSNKRVVTGRFAAVAAAAGLIASASCNENLPAGPNTFAASLSILAPHDTVVVGDVNQLTARATDDQGHIIQGLSYTWATSNASVGAIQATSDTTGGTVGVHGAHTGLAVIGLSLPDPRFVSSQVTRTQTVVVAGIQVLSTHDSTLTAVNDTGTAVAMGLVHANGATVTSPGQTVTWTHLGSHVTTFGSNTGLASDTLRYVARSNGADTLIANDAYCLAGSKCADTTIIHVSQQLSLTLSGKQFQAWSFNDSVGPTVRLADRRGNGLAGTTVRLIPVTAVDSSIVSVTPPIGASNPTTGQLAAPELVATANGIARVAVVALGSDLSVIASDTITAAVRQVARRVGVEPFRALITANDSIPISPVARDARGAPIGDANIDLEADGISVHGIWAGPVAYSGTQIVSTVTPSLIGIALPSNNPGAPQIAPEIDPAQITIIQPDTAKAGAVVTRTIFVTAFDSTARPASGKYVRFGTTVGIVPDSAFLDASGSGTTLWLPPDSARVQTLTGLRGTINGPQTLADSAGRIVLRHSVLVLPDVPSPATSTLTVGVTSIPANGTINVVVQVRDRFNNLVTTATTADVTFSAPGGGTFSNISCSGGLCSATYTAPAAPGNDSIHAQIMGSEIAFSPVAITIT